MGVSANTIKEYFSIVEDTLLGSFLPPFLRRPKRRTTQASKFYFFDVGIVNHLARRGELIPGGELYGKAFENWVQHELRTYNEYSSLLADLSYWRLTTGVEVDFVLGHEPILACEAKAKIRLSKDDLAGLRAFKEEYPEGRRLVVVSLEERTRVTEDGILVLSPKDFIARLWEGALTS